MVRFSPRGRPFDRGEATSGFLIFTGVLSIFSLLERLVLVSFVISDQSLTAPMFFGCARVFNKWRSGGDSKVSEKTICYPSVPKRPPPSLTPPGLIPLNWAGQWVGAVVVLHRPVTSMSQAAESPSTRQSCSRDTPRAR